MLCIRVNLKVICGKRFKDLLENNEILIFDIIDLLIYIGKFKCIKI